MDERDWLAGQFEAHRSHLQAVAYRMLGSLCDADDAVQEAWIRFSRSGASQVENIGAWLTTIVSRICLDMLRIRKARREEPMDMHADEPVNHSAGGNDPEREALLAESVGVALLVVLDMLSPAERVAFVLHDIFSLSFAEIAPIVGRSPDAARQLASRARRRVHGATVPDADQQRQRVLVDAFIAASKAGDFGALLSLLDPDVILKVDPASIPMGAPTEFRGAMAVVSKAEGRAHFAQPALVNGEVGVIDAPNGRLYAVLRLRFRGGKIAEIELVTNPNRIRQLDLAVFAD